ncbi:MAG TPA: OmpA family protein [Gammaproteobacteria bacterium]|nr:OmpA family protein [Gammaproteobacteria bacterium]
MLGKRFIRATICALFALLSCVPAWRVAAQQDLRSTLFAEADRAREAARAANAELLAPDAFARGNQSYTGAEADLERGRNIERIRSALAASSTAFKEAAQAAEIANVTLASVIKTRDDANKANAATFAAQQWNDAGAGFTAAARRLESGDIRGARSRADEAEKLFRDAELTAIKAQYLSQTRALLAEAEQMRVPRVAPTTYAKAQQLLAQAEMELNNNRYDTDLPRSLAQQANYEARHAIALAKVIGTMRDQDRSLEDVILRYEDPLVQIGAAADKAIQLDDGIEPVTKDLVSYVESLRERAAQSERDLADGRTRVAELEEEIRGLDERLGGVSQERTALVQKLEAESRIREQFATIESSFDRNEARVSREGNRVIVRLVGVTFPSGNADINPRVRPLLEKLRAAVDVFPRSQIVIEGHTDSYGSDEANLALSRKRAEAIGAYLTNPLGVPAFRISAVGYGETQPIANNDTAQGRERNRRIDVIIEPQLEAQ